MVQSKNILEDPIGLSIQCLLSSKSQTKKKLNPSQILEDPIDLSIQCLLSSKSQRKKKLNPSQILYNKLEKYLSLHL